MKVYFSKILAYPNCCNSAIAVFTVYKQVFCYVNFANQRTKESFVSTANKLLFGTIGEVLNGEYRYIFSTYMRIITWINRY